MPSALILLADGSEEMEFVTPYDVLVRAGFDVQSAGVDLKAGEYAVCSRNVRIIPDRPQPPTMPTTDILVLPGGAAGAKTFCNSVAVQALISAYRQAGKWVATICAATTALVKAGGKKVTVTSHPSVREEVEAQGWKYSEGRVVVDGGEKIMTSRGPGTALLFALTIVELLVSKKKRDEVAEPMILAQTL